MKTTKVSNKNTFLANACVVWFPRDKRDFPFPMFVRGRGLGINCFTDVLFYSDFKLNLTNSLSFSRMRNKFKEKLFPQPPMLSGSITGMVT